MPPTQGHASINTTLSANVETLTLTGATAINATVNAQDHLLTGNSAANVLNGVTGIDTLIGGAGNDTNVVGSGDDVISELAGQGIDTVQTSAANAPCVRRWRTSPSPARRQAAPSATIWPTL